MRREDKNTKTNPEKTSEKKRVRQRKGGNQSERERGSKTKQRERKIERKNGVINTPIMLH